MTSMLIDLTGPVAADGLALAVADTRAGQLLADDPWWLVLGKALAIFVFLVVMTLFAILAERKVVAKMQHRTGPNRVGPFGSLQSLADGIKLALKEDIVPKAADKVVYILAPIISVIPAFTAFAVIPLGPEVSIFGETTVLQLVDLSVGVLFILAAASIGVYGIVLGGWSSGSTYPLLGGLRSTAQVISYEIAMGLSFVAVFLYAGSLATSEIVAAQERLWFAIALLPSFVIYLIAMVGETNRAPFDLAEAEGELVGGFHTEYSSLKFALFFLAEYINMVTVSALATTLFLGGWQAPWPLSIWDGANEGWLPVLWFVAKVLLFLFFFIWLRGTLPRLRYDQFMKLGWKILIPFALGWTMIVAVVRGITQDTGVDRQDFFFAVAVVFGLILLATLVAEYVGRRREPDALPAGDGRTSGTGGGVGPGGAGGSGGTPFDPFAGGHPVPPMPGQQAEQVPVLTGGTRSGAEAGHPADSGAAGVHPEDDTRTENTRG